MQVSHGHVTQSVKIFCDVGANLIKMDFSTVSTSLCGDESCLLISLYT